MAGSLVWATGFNSIMDLSLYRTALFGLENGDRGAFEHGIRQYQ